MKKESTTERSAAGFTLAEVLVAIAVGSIVMALIAAAYWTQTQTSKNQEMIVEMQQNMRFALFAIQREVMMAGYEPDASDPAGTAVTVANPQDLEFTYVDPIQDEDNLDNDDDGTIDEDREKDGVDNDGDGNIDEQNELETVRFFLTDADGDGTSDELVRQLIADFTGTVRDSGIIADNIEDLEFLYTLADGATTTSPADPEDVRQIGVSILARTAHPVSGYTDRRMYSPLSYQLNNTVWGPYDDHFRRQLVTTTIHCRNMRQY